MEYTLYFSLTISTVKDHNERNLYIPALVVLYLRTERSQLEETNVESSKAIFAAPWKKSQPIVNIRIAENTPIGQVLWTQIKNGQI